MILPLFLVIADLMLFWLFADIVSRLPTLEYGGLLVIATFGMAFSCFVWLIIESVQLAFSGEKKED